MRKIQYIAGSESQIQICIDVVDNSQKHAIKTGTRHLKPVNDPIGHFVTKTSPLSRRTRTMSNWRVKSQANKSSTCGLATKAVNIMCKSIHNQCYHLTYTMT